MVLEAGTWLVSVGSWVLPLRLEAADDPAAPDVPGLEQPETQEKRVQPNGAPGRRGSPPRPDAPDRVRAWFARNSAARMAMAYHYQELILGLPGAQPVPMMDVVIALDLSGEGAISDYKKQLQGLIWKERGHPRELAEYLLTHGLLPRPTWRRPGRRPRPTSAAARASRPANGSGTSGSERQGLRRPYGQGLRRPGTETAGQPS